MEVDIDKNVLLFLNNSAEHGELPETEQNVRVTEYNSKMIIKPHHSYTEVCMYVSVCHSVCLFVCRCQKLLLYSLQQIPSSALLIIYSYYQQNLNNYIGFCEFFPNNTFERAAKSYKT